MKITIKLLIFVVFLLSLTSVSVFAVTPQQNPDVQALAKQLSQLQNEMASLKSQLRHSHQAVSHTASTQSFAMHKRSGVPSSSQAPHHTGHTQQVYTPVSNPVPASTVAPLPVSSASAAPLPQISGPSTNVHYWPMDVGVPGRALVSTGPYIGVPLEFSGSSLIINSPNINEDVTLLDMRKKINCRYNELNIPEDEQHSHLILSGELEGQIGYLRAGHGASSSDIDLTTAELDGYVLGPSHWTTGLITFGFDNSGASYLGNSRISNSRVFVNKAFITIGDFQKSPAYLTIGQLYVPFGVYSTNLVTPPLTKSLGRTKNRALVLGYWGQRPNDVYASAYIFRGDTYAESQCGSLSCRINNGGLNFGVKLSLWDKMVTGKIGAGVIANIADSVGMQSAAFGNPTPLPPPPAQSNENIVHRVPAYNINLLLNLGDHWNVIAEYVGASTPFNVVDMEINNIGAKPFAARGELSYSFKTCRFPSSVAVAYGHTHDVLALALPKDRYSVVFNTSFWRNTLESLEFRHDVKYPSSYTASGKGVSPISSSLTPALLGRPDNAVTLQMDLYF